MSISRPMGKQNVIYPHTGMLLSRKKEGRADTCYYVDETWIYYAEGKKAETKDHML